MFENIGKKIKGLTKTIFYIGCAIPIVVGIILMAMEEDLLLVGLLVMVVGVFLSWISVWLLYGYGELIDKVCDIERNTRLADDSPEAISNKTDKFKDLLSQGLITQEDYEQLIQKQ